MPIDKKRFAAVFLVGNLLLLGVGAGVVMGGVAVAVPTAGVGGFTVTFDELSGQGFQQYATLENNSDCSAYPASVAQIEKGTIEGLKLYKDIQSPTGDTVRVMITSDETVQFTGLTQKFTYLTGDLTFDQGQKIEAGAPSSDIEDQLSLSGPAITIKDGKIKAQSQFVQSITLQGAVVKTVVNPDETNELPKGACAQPA